MMMHNTPHPMDADPNDQLLISAREYQRLKRMEGLLKVARCPDTNCVDGAVGHLTIEGYDDHGNVVVGVEAQQCQWCYEKCKALEDE